jgi:EmrB/QacA subfamily drug resistance transporter
VKGTAAVGSAGPRTAADAATPELSRGRRTAALVTVCASLLVITIDVTILNVALPTLAAALNADTTALQWFINAYEVVFAGLLLTAGALADRVGRRRVLAVGLAVFGVASALSALAGSSAQLIGARVVMGVGGALVLPATLSIVTNMFTEPRERARAIAVWAGVAALGLGLGPLVGGWLLQRLYWGSVFLVNVPVVIGALVAGRLTIPESRDPGAARLDPLGAALSVAALGALLFGVTDAPETGWTHPVILASFVAGALGLGAFVAWERHVAEPMLDLRFFRDPRFSAAIVAIMSLFFGLFGLMFVSTQTLQSVLGYDTLGAGLRLVPLPAMFVVFAQISVRVAARAGTKRVVTAGLVIAATGLGVGASLDAGSGYGVLAVALSLTGIGMGCTMAPAIESIMGSVPRQRAGVASAVNDTTRLTAGAIGVAVVGSVLSSGYRGAFTADGTAGSLPPELVEQAQASIANAAAVAHRLGGTEGERLLEVARQGFIDGASTGLLIASVVAALGAIAAWRFLPSSAQATPRPHTPSDATDAGATPSHHTARPAPPDRPGSATDRVGLADRAGQSPSVVEEAVQLDDEPSPRRLVAQQGRMWLALSRATSRLLGISVARLRPSARGARELIKAI